MNLYGRLMVNLSEDRNFALQDYAEEINRIIKPPAKVVADDIYVRAIYLVSDKVNSYGGRFPKEELGNLSRLIIDSPVLVGHNKNSLPIARNFKAAVVENSGESWVKVWFYWLKKSEGSRALLANIDGGIYKEGSIGFIFSLPECGICGQDIRNCEHVPLRNYGQGADEKICHYNYRKIEKVLETSLVFRGANPDTRTTNELIFNHAISRKNGDDDRKSPAGIRKAENIYFSIFDFNDSDGNSYATPLLFGMPVICHVESGKVRIKANGREIQLSPSCRFYRELINLGKGDLRLAGSLFKMRGKQRLPLYLWKDDIFRDAAGDNFRFLVDSIVDCSGDALDSEKSTVARNKIKSCFYINLRKYRKIGNDFHLVNGSKHGLAIIGFGRKDECRFSHLRKSGIYLLKVCSSERTHANKFCHEVAFENSDDDPHLRTYETSIPAIPGDTLLIRAVKSSDKVRPAGLIVEDNLGCFYPADDKTAIIYPQEKSNKYHLRLTQESAILLVENRGQRLSVVFPQFNQGALDKNKALIGYPVTRIEKLKDVLNDDWSYLQWETGNAYTRKSSCGSHIVELDGKSLSGRYSLRPAFWNRRKLLLFSKLN